MTATRRDFTPVRLDPYEEIRGRLQSIRDDGTYVYIELSSGTLQFVAESREANICRHELRGEEGSLVSVLRTPMEASPIRVRIENGAD